MMRWAWAAVAWLRCRLGHPAFFDRFWEYRGYRRAVGGAWDHWSMSFRADGSDAFPMWIPRGWGLQVEKDGVPGPICRARAAPVASEEWA
jgi:hypothetical protein